MVLWLGTGGAFQAYGQDPAQDQTPSPEIEDPLESLNRAIFDFNLALDDTFVEPAVHVYQTIFPTEIQDCLHAALQNLNQPLIFVNCVLQIDPEKAGYVLLRFLINSTFGLLGLFDVATEEGIPAIEEDFGKTLKMLDIPVGPYLVLPILGPSSFRDGFGMGVDFLINPLNRLFAPRKYAKFFWIRGGLDLFDKRVYYETTFSELKKTSLDLYATLRSLYDQTRGDNPSNSLEAPSPLENYYDEIID